MQFFLFRQKEWEDYRETYPMGFVRQGELTDPNYFDFISYSQVSHEPGLATRER